ncbi:uncharacterized protein LOC134783035 [Penaeus indicus]|uniref:uncharacterized protein LOC134783035 n=1 Tax=Penaeus indicus TaxID=29960 RepID=UPI00300C19AE
MNSFVSVDREEDAFSLHGDPTKPEEDSSHGGDSCSSSAGSVVLLLPKENVVVEASEDEASPDVIPITVDNIPVYLSRSADGTPLFIRRRPPTMEELLLTSPDEATPSFDGFSEASGKTFEGFSEASGKTFEGFSETSGRTFDGFSEGSGSTFEGFSEASRCSSAGSGSFEGFTDEVVCFRDEDRISTCLDPKTVKRTEQSGGASRVSSLGSRKRSHSLMQCSESPSEDKVVLGSESTGVRTRKQSQGHAKEEEEVESSAVVSVKKEAENRTSNSPLEKDVNVVHEETDQDVTKQNRVDSTQDSPNKRKRGRPRLNSNMQIEAGSVEILSEDFIGKYCNRVGCTISWLESFRTMCITPVNGMVYELSEFANKIAWEQDYIAVWLLRLCGFTGTMPTAEDHAKVRVILKRRKALMVTLAGQKFGSAKLQEFDETKFILPTVSDVKLENVIHEQTIENLVSDVRRSKRQRVAKPLEEVEEISEYLGDDVTCKEEEITFSTNLETVEVKEEQEDKSLVDSSVKTFQAAGKESVLDSSPYTCQTSSGTDEAVGIDTSTSCVGITQAGEKKQTGSNKFKGTLGVSKSGRVRKPSAKGSVSIEFKYLFMEKQGPFTESSNPGVSATQNEENNDLKKSTYSKGNATLPAENETPTQKERTKKCFIGPRHLNKYIDMENKRVSFTLEDGRVIPCFKELDYNLGPRSCAVGLTVGDLNTKDKLDIKLSNGIVKELFDFYISRGSTLTSLVCRLFWMLGVPHDPGRILSTTSKIGILGRTLQADHPKANEVFSLPEKMPYRIHRPSVKTLQNKIKKSGKVLKKYHSSRRKALHSKLKHSKLLGKKEVEKRSPPEEEANSMKMKCATALNSPQSEDLTIEEEVIKTRGKEGSITRGDIVYLYTQWLRNKKKLGSNVFVTDLLKNVEQLMAERKIKLIRVPAGTLMSSSVKLYDEYKQMCNINKEDAMMYLEDDWLEDIQYLLSQSRPVRRSTFEGDSTSCKTDPDDTGSHQSIGGDVSDSDISERNLIIDEGSDEGKQQSGTKKSRTANELLASRRVVSNTVKSVVEDPSHGRRDETLLRKTRLRSYKKGYYEEFVSDFEDPSHDRRDETLLRKTRLKSCKKSYYEEFVSDFEDLDSEDEFLKEKSVTAQTSKGQIKKIIRSENKLSTKSEGNTFSFSKEEYEVEKILDFRYIRDKEKERVQYLVRWSGFTQDDDSWVDENDLDCPKILEDFWDAEDFCKKPDRSKVCAKKREESLSRYADEIKTHYTPFRKGESDKENDGDILEVLMRHTSVKRHIGRPRARRLSQSHVSVQEILELYNTWRRDNQNVLMAGGSNTVNVDTLVKSVKKLMASKNITNFHPESLLNACFMMTLIRTRLKSEEALKNFLDSSCVDVFEASHKQQLASREKHKSQEGVLKKTNSDKSITIQNLQNELQELQCNLTLAEGARWDSRCALTVVESEVECLENICRDVKKDNTDTVSSLQHELETLRENVRSSVMKGCRGNELCEGKSSKVSDTTKAQLLEEKAVGGKTVTIDNEMVLTGAEKELSKLGIPDDEVHSVMEMVLHKVGGRTLRARPQKVGLAKSV